MNEDPRVTEQLADFVAASCWEDIPIPVRREGVRSLLNFVGCALGGCQDEAVSLATRVLRPYFGGAQASLIGRNVINRASKAGLRRIRTGGSRAETRA